MKKLRIYLTLILISLLGITGCSGNFVSEDTMAEITLAKANTISFGTMGFIINNDYGTEISDLNRISNNMFSFALKGVIQVNMRVEDNSQILTVVAPRDAKLYEDIGNLALFITDTKKFEPEILNALAEAKQTQSIFMNSIVVNDSGWSSKYTGSTELLDGDKIKFVMKVSLS